MNMNMDIEPLGSDNITGLDEASDENQENVLIDDLFSSDGILKEKFKLFEIREEQIRGKSMTC